MEYEIGGASEELIPYLIHFGEKCIGPKIISVEGFIIKFKRIEGQRLDDFLYETKDVTLLSNIYGKMGSYVGNVSRLNILHGDLRPDNVIVEEKSKHPVIIDWETVSFLGITRIDSKEKYEFWMSENDEFLFETKEILEDEGRVDEYSQLEDAYSKRFKEELLKPLHKDSIKNIHQRAYELHGVF